MNPQVAHSYIDSHCHFDFSDFDIDRDQVWQSSLKAGLKGMFIPGVSPDQWPAACGLSETLSNCHYGAGLHPWWIEKEKKLVSSNEIDLKQLVNRIVQEIDQPHCIAIGECGLDKRCSTPMSLQQDLFVLQANIAAEYGLPLIVHCVKAHNEVFQGLKKSGASKGVIHGFSGSAEMARSYWDMGFYLGVGGTITYERANKTREAVRQIPLEAIVLESDAPDMPLCGKQGQRNSPEYLPLVLSTIAELRNQTIDEIAHQLFQNTTQLFNRFKI